MPFRNFCPTSRPVRYRAVCERCGEVVSSFYSDSMDDHLEQAHGVAYDALSRARPLRPFSEWRPLENPHR